MSIGQELLNVPMGDMIREMAFAIAEAQLRLDEASIETAEMMGGLKTIVDDDGNVTFDDSRVFFGAEYMTVGEALVSQVVGNDDDNVVNSVLGDINVRVAMFANTATPPSDPPTYNFDEIITYDDEATWASVPWHEYQEYLLTLEDALINPPPPNASTKKNIEKNIEENRTKNLEAMNREVRIPTRISLLELGFAPVFYSFVDTIIEVKISISITRSSSYSRSTSDKARVKEKQKQYVRLPFLAAKKSKKKTVSTSQVNAAYSSRYSYTAEGSSLLRTKLSPIPTPPLLEERIRALMDAEQERRQAKLDLLQSEPASGEPVIGL